MDIQKELYLKTEEEASIHFDVFTGTPGDAGDIKDVRIGKAFNLYFLVEEDTTAPLRITIQKQVALEIKGERVYRDFGDPELVMIEYSNKIYGLDVTPRPIFDRLVVASSDGIGGDVVHVLLKIL